MGIATFGTGCFWCTEAVFQQLKGAKSVVSGFSGGHVENPSYEQVIAGTTGHVEVCQIEFDPDQISFEDLLEVFFNTHDPTTLNRQGNDHGPQYRSAIFYHSEEQREIASQLLEKLGYSVTSVSSGEEAVEYLKKHTVNLIVLDMIMDPGIDGLDTYKQILELHPGQKAIIASGFSETERVKEAQRLGAGQYIKKPFILEKIGLAIKGELEK